MAGNATWRTSSLSQLFSNKPLRSIQLRQSPAPTRELVRKGCEVFEKCEDMINKLGMFSANETMDDISTTNLKYLLVPSYLAELMEKVAQGDRIQILKASQAKLKEFTSFCEAMELVQEEELDTSRQKGSNYPVDLRDFKTAGFYRQRAAQTKLLEINKRKKERHGFSSKAAALSTPVEAGEEDVLDEDGEEEREGSWPGLLPSCWQSALDLLEMLNKEEEMLSAIKEKQSKEGDKGFSQVVDDRSKRAEAWHRNAAARARYTKPAEPITCATFAQDVLEGRVKASKAHDHKHQPLAFGPLSLVGGSITSERKKMEIQVFQPSYRLPTVSIEEAGLREMETMNKRQEKNAKLMEDANSSWYKDNRKQRPGEEDDDDDEDDDASQEKARAWDGWKDNNPRGAGNKKLTPCG